MPSIGSIGEARKLLLEDKAIALQTIAQIGEDGLGARVAPPWAPDEFSVLGRLFLQMVQHLDQHKAQLFYYLKLQGKLVNTADLWGP
jgi:hypothetical protein